MKCLQISEGLADDHAAVDTAQRAGETYLEVLWGGCSLAGVGGVHLFRANDLAAVSRFKSMLGGLFGASIHQTLSIKKEVPMGSEQKVAVITGASRGIGVMARMTAPQPKVQLWPLRFGPIGRRCLLHEVFPRPVEEPHIDLIETVAECLGAD